ncbi:MAG: DUF4270 family protein [Bacteroidales bacterium]|nr:DUF4270 family protein [Bacteroidales bacterium]
MIKKISPLKSRFLCISGCFFSIVLLSTVLTGCVDDPYQVGLELLPGDDSIRVRQVDTLTIEAYTIGPEGIPVFDSANIPLGTFTDEIFGETTASLLFELSPGNYNAALENAFTVDTVAMYLSYDVIFGDTLYRPQIEVYAGTGGIEKKTRYYSDYDMNGQYDPVNLVIPAAEYTDSIKRIKLKLRNEFGQSLLQTTGLNDSVAFTTYKIDSIFDANFKGLYLKAAKQTGDRGILNIKSINLAVYFHTSSDTSYMTFSFSPYDDRYTVHGPLGDKFIKVFNHDYTGKISSMNDFSQQDSALYLKSLGGTQVKLVFPSLEQLKQQIGRVSVNSAEMFIPFLGDLDYIKENYYPNQLGMRIYEDGFSYLPEDVLYQKSNNSIGNYMNGSIDTTAMGYKFILTGYIHEYMKGNITSNELRLFAGQNDTKIGHTNFNPSFYTRMILAGTGNPDKKITFKIAFTYID